MLDGLVQLSVLDRDLTAPPGSPADGDRYIVASGATGDWAGWDLNVALWTDGAWLRLAAADRLAGVGRGRGLCCWSTMARAGSAPRPDALQNMALLGLGTTADAANPFSAKLNAALWTAKTVAEGGTGDLFYTMNKEAAGDDLGLTLQTGFVTKALVGLFGSDRFRLAVSADGSTFFDGLSVDNATGIVDQPRLPRFKACTNYDNYVGVGTWTKIGLNNTDYNDQGGLRRREQPLRGPGRRHLPLRRDAALQGQRQRHGPHAWAARAERHDRNPRLPRRDLRHPCLARHRHLAADHGAADGGRYR